MRPHSGSATLKCKDGRPICHRRPQLEAVSVVQRAASGRYEIFRGPVQQPLHAGEGEHGVYGATSPREDRDSRIQRLPRRPLNAPGQATGMPVLNPTVDRTPDATGAVLEA